MEKKGETDPMREKTELVSEKKERNRLVGLGRW